MREPGESETAYFKRRFAEASDDETLDMVDDQLREEGYAPEKIKPRKSERRKELQKQSRVTTAVARSTGGQLSAEEIVNNLPWPTSVDGEVNPVFVAGMRYEAMNVIRGIRMAQQLNQMGLEQAKPVIEMAKEMRQSEGQAAQTIAAQLGQVTLQSNQQILSAIRELAAAQSQEQPSGVDPWTSAVFSAALPFFGPLLQRLFASFSGLPQQPGQPSQQPAVSQMSGQPIQQAESKPPTHLKPEEENEWTEA